MLNRLRRRLPVVSWLFACSLASSCQPTRDLDATTRGTPRPLPQDSAGSPSGGGGLDNGGTSGTGTGGGGGGGAVAGGGAAGTFSGTAPSLGGSEEQPGSGGADANLGGESSAGAAGEIDTPLGDLPNELADSPIQGMLTFSEATVAGEKTFQIVSPLATYAVTASNGSITALDDRSGGNIVQWVGASSRRKRRAGIVTTPEPVMTTSVDEGSLTARHVRLLSTSETGDWVWTWDFYVTQATLTLKEAAGAYAFTFSGTPGDQLTSADNLVPSLGVGQSAVGSFLADLPGPAEWAYLTDATYGHSLFVIQHADDDLLDRYDALGGDTATLVFGDGQLTRAQRRFSLGFLASTVHANVARRVEFVIGAVQ